MSYGLPVVATDVGGNTEVLIRGGGTLVSIDDLDSLGQAIANYVNDENLRYEDGARAREVIEENYTTQHMAERLGAVYRDILSSGKL
jgi:glycosyltransferase involved in cell wall biosynthesis